MGDAVAEADLADPNPDVRSLFLHYDGLYFQRALADAGFVVQWTSSPTYSSFGSCTFSKPRNTITLSEPVLKYLSSTDLKNALLHEMIHAIIYVKHHRKDRQHGPIFRAWMEAINSCSMEDSQRPDGGYTITTRHDFSPEEPHRFKSFLWKCDSCGDTLMRPTNKGPPSDACCIENVDSDASCGNMLCHWHNHKNECCGAYEKSMVQSDTPFLKKVPGDTQLLLTYPSEIPKSQKSIQESNSSALQGNSDVTGPNAEDKPPSLVSGSNGKSQGNSSSKKAGKQRKPEDVQKPNVLPAATLGNKKLKHGLITTEKNKLSSFEDCNAVKSLISDTSKNATRIKRHKPENIEKQSVLPAVPLGNLKLKHDLIATEKNELLSADGSNCAKSLGVNAPKKACKRHKIVDAEDHSVLPAASLGTPTLEPESIEIERRKNSPVKGCNNAKSPKDTSKKAGKQHEAQSSQKACSQAAYPLRSRKPDSVGLDKNELSHAMVCHSEKVPASSSKKAHEQHKPEGIEKTAVLQSVPGNKRKQSSFVASGKRKRECRRKPARENEFAVMSAFLDYYESDRSSGSTEPLVNKRTERRRKERELIRSNSLSKKIDSVPLNNHRTNTTVSSHKIKTEQLKDQLKQQLPSSPCSYNAILTTRHQEMTQATGDQSQPPAPCLDIVPLQPAEPPCPTPNHNITSEPIVISDDD